MAWIRILNEDEASPDLAELYTAMCDPVSGEVDNILKIHSLHPRGLQAHFHLYTAVMAGTKGVRKVDREMIAVVVSVANQCHY